MARGGFCFAIVAADSAVLNFIAFVCSWVSTFAAMNNRVDIQFKGLTTSPSDYACSDGELAICHNVVNDGGELRPVMPPKVAFRLPHGCILLYIHKTSSCTIALFSNADEDVDEVDYADLDKYKSGSGGYAVLHNKSDWADGQISMSSIGNILIVTDSNKDSHYYRFASGSYTYLDKGLPQLPRIAFGLHNATKSDEAHYPVDRRPTFTSESRLDVELDCNTSFIKLKNDDDTALKTVFDSLMGKLIESEKYASGNGAFNQPFFVRYAFRLYDGSTCRVSPPVLMVPRSGAPDVLVYGYPKNYWSDGGDSYMQFSFDTHISYLRYCLADVVDLDKWEDIIDGVDVFVSAPIRVYRQDASLDDWRGVASANMVFISTHWETYPERNSKYYGASDTIVNNAIVSAIDDDGFIDYTKFDTNIPTYPAREQSGMHSGRFMSPLKTSAEVAHEMENVSTFYHIATIPLKDLSGDQGYGKFKRVVIKSGVLDTLTVRETLKEDYLSNYTIKSSNNLVYNSRLVKSGDYRDITTNFTLDTMTQYLFKRGTFGTPGCYVRLVKAGVEYLVPLGRNSLPLENKGNWLFYPDPDAKELIFSPSTPVGGVLYYYVPLKRHEILQGAYWAPEDTDSNFGYGYFKNYYASAPPIGDTHTLVPVRSSIYVSEVNNPFVFPSGLSATVGNGNIMALAATTLPISEGQQGQFPVMAFTDEGIWALSVGDTGSLVATNPMLRDVLSDPDSLCVIDDGVVYATNEGIRILRGKQSALITEALKGKITGGTSIKTDIRRLLAGSRAGMFAHPDSGDPSTMFDGCRIIYSSTLRRLYVLTTNTSWSPKTALVYSLDTGLWSSAMFPYKYPVAMYPTTYVQKVGATGTDVYDMNDEDNADTTFTNDAVVLTRPLTFGARNMPKTIMETIVRGRFSSSATARNPEGWVIDPVTGNKVYGSWGISSEINTVLYGSNDLDHWLVVGSSACERLSGRVGTPYKYYRLLVVAPLGLHANKSIAGATLDVQLRLNNTLR